MPCISSELTFIKLISHRRKLCGSPPNRIWNEKRPLPVDGKGLYVYKKDLYPAHPVKVLLTTLALPIKPGR